MILKNIILKIVNQLTLCLRNWLMKIKPVDIEFDNTEIQEIRKSN